MALCSSALYVSEFNWLPNLDVLRAQDIPWTTQIGQSNHHNKQIVTLNTSRQSNALNNTSSSCECVCRAWKIPLPISSFAATVVRKSKDFLSKLLT